MKHVIIFLATVGYIGKLPLVPATILSALTALLIFVIASPLFVITLAVASFAIGLLIAVPAVGVFKDPDPQAFVLDELAGMAIAMVLVPISANWVVTAFILFRFFDVVKPLGIRTLDKMSHPVGIVLDDVLAGIYTNLVLQVLIRVI
jgi:phosphatidylglycerophosphatase A